MSWVVTATFIVIIAIFAIVHIKLSQKQAAGQPEFSYKKIDILFSPAERSFFGVLKQVVGNNAEVFGKVRVADVIMPQKGMSRSKWQTAFNKISGKHFDFLLCDKNDLSVLCAIELNDSSHNSKKRKERDRFLEGACQSANVPIIQIAAKATYSIGEIQQSIAAYLPGILPQETKKESVVSSTEQQSQNVGKLCPKCSSVMVKRTARKGKNMGKEFWACSAYPKCRHIEAIDS